MLATSIEALAFRSGVASPQAGPLLRPPRSPSGMNTASMALVPPFARAVRCRAVAYDFGRRDRGALREPLAQRLRHVGHGTEIIDAGVMYPAQQLLRPKRFLAQASAKILELLATKPEQVSCHCTSSA